MWVLKTKGKTYYVNHVEADCKWSTKETPDNDHTKGSIKFKDCYLTINNGEAYIRVQREMVNTALDEINEIPGSIPGARSNIYKDKLYILSDSSLSTGFQAVQGAHALHKWIEEHEKLSKEFYLNPTLIFLTASKEEIDNIIISSNNVSIWQEPDVNNYRTAVCLYAEEYNIQLIKKLKLLK